MGTKFEKNLRVYVGERDAEKGTRQDTETCPVARALSRKLGRKVEVSMNGAVAVYAKRSNSIVARYKLSEEATNRIEEFDRGASFRTGKFRLRRV